MVWKGGVRMVDGSEDAPHRHKLRVANPISDLLTADEFSQRTVLRDGSLSQAVDGLLSPQKIDVVFIEHDTHASQFMMVRRLYYSHRGGITPLEDRSARTS